MRAARGMKGWAGQPSEGKEQSSREKQGWKSQSPQEREQSSRGVTCKAAKAILTAGEKGHDKFVSPVVGNPGCVGFSIPGGELKPTMETRKHAKKKAQGR